MENCKPTLERQARAITVSYLADTPHHLYEVATWLYQKWGHAKQGNSVQTTEARLTQELKTASIPCVLIATLDKKLLGVARLCEHDLETHLHLTPWLASVFVVPQFRSKGVGAKLVKSVEELARDLDINTLYLKTRDRQHFYNHLGWKTLESVSVEIDQTTIMYKNISQRFKEGL